MKAAPCKGDSFLADAEKALARTSIFGFGKNQKHEDAAEAYTKAGNAFKLATLWESAGKAFVKAAEQHAVLNNTSDAASSYVEAGNSYRKINPKKGIKAFSKAIEIFNDAGRFAQSARYYKEVAEIFEADNNTDGAIDAYHQAANLFSNDNKTSNANQCLLKIANLASTAGQYSKAAEIFETIGRESLTSNLGKYAAKGYFTQCVLCLLGLGDGVAGRSKLDDFKNADFSFPASRECDFLEKLITAFDGNNIDDFEQACADFDRITPLGTASYFCFYLPYAPHPHTHTYCYELFSILSPPPPPHPTSPLPHTHTTMFPTPIICTQFYPLTVYLDPWKISILPPPAPAYIPPTYLSPQTNICTQLHPLYTPV